MNIIKEFYPEERKPEYLIRKVSSLCYYIDWYYSGGTSITMVHERKCADKTALVWLILNYGVTPYEMTQRDMGNVALCGEENVYRTEFTFSPKYN